MTGSAASTRSPSRRTTSRSVPWVAGCCGPEVEDHVAGVELDVRPARRRGAAARAGRPRTAGSVAWCRSCSCRSRPRRPPRRPRRASSPSPGIGSTSTRPGHGFTTRDEQREVLAQRVALELRREVEVAQARVAVEARCRTSPSTRARASRRRGTRAPTTRREERVSSTSTLSVTPQCRLRRLHVREHLEAARRSRRRRRSSRSAAPAPTCRRRPRRRPPSAPASSRCRR